MFNVQRPTFNVQRSEADGWYAGYVGFGKKREHYGSKPRLFVQLEIEYADGGMQTVITDNSWKATHGPHLEADFLMGETYDARKEMTGWAQDGFDDSNWHAVAVTDKVQGQPAAPLAGKLQSYPGVTVQKILEIKPKKLTEPQKGVYVFDMGQNFAGASPKCLKEQTWEAYLRDFYFRLGR